MLGDVITTMDDGYCPSCGRCRCCGRPRFDLRIVPQFPPTVFPSTCQSPPAGVGADVVLDDHQPSSDSHGDDGRLLDYGC